MPSQIWAEESIVIDDWLITSDDTACWASALIAEDPINDEYDSNKDFQLTVSFHNRVPLPQFTITSVTEGKTVTSASVKFNEDKLDNRLYIDRRDYLVRRLQTISEETEVE